MGRLDSRTALITGAASGMGRATAVRFLADGASVVAFDLDALGLASLRDEAAGSALEVLAGDVTVSADVRRAVELSETRFGALDVVCNCAGTAVCSSVLETTDEMWDRVLDVNLKGVFYGCKFAIPAMQRAGGGSIVNWASSSALVAEANYSAYCASKGAVLMLTKTVAIEHAKDGIRANALCPGWVDTPMTDALMDQSGYRALLASIKDVQPLGMGTAEQVASVASFLASEESSLMTGSAVLVDGGMTAL
jgi:meso-butanediol dehydrogenase/(S,S)-butanediol dehydrogenase/diacetyl reductase